MHVSDETGGDVPFLLPPSSLLAHLAGGVWALCGSASRVNFSHLVNWSWSQQFFFSFWVVPAFERFLYSIEYQLVQTAVFTQWSAYSQWQVAAHQHCLQLGIDTKPWRKRVGLNMYSSKMLRIFTKLLCPFRKLNINTPLPRRLPHRQTVDTNLEFPYREYRYFPLPGNMFSFW